MVFERLAQLGAARAAADIADELTIRPTCLSCAETTGGTADGTNGRANFHGRSE